MYAVYLTVYYGEKLPPFYIGSSSIEKIEKGYCGSVRSKKYKEIFREELKNNKHLFDVIVISTHQSRAEAIDIELKLQKDFNVVKSDKFFNEAYASVNGMFGRDVSGKNNPMFGKKHSEETKKKITEKRGNDKRYDVTDKHREIISKIHKGKIVSDETKDLISKNRKGKNTGKNNPMFGKTHSDEVKNKISKSNTGKTHSEETKNKISEATKGKVINYETRQKISIAKTGKKREPFSEEWLKKLSLSKKGRVMSEETKEKLIKSKTGMKYKESICPHCGKIGGGGNMIRYHFENCKLKG